MIDIGLTSCECITSKKEKKKKKKAFTNYTNYTSLHILLLYAFNKKIKIIDIVYSK